MFALNISPTVSLNILDIVVSLYASLRDHPQTILPDGPEGLNHCKRNTPENEICAFGLRVAKSVEAGGIHGSER